MENKASWLRKKWLSFFSSKEHFDISGKSIIPPASDKSLLFINSGVAAIKAYFSGDLPPPSSRLVSCQAVIRTGDIESIGESLRHHTYFEMLGNFSLEDYFKAEAIAWAWEFLTKELGLKPELLYVTIYEEDKEAYEEWLKLIPKEQIIKGGKDTNFWDMGVGPCGPCTEIYFDKGEKYDPSKWGLKLLKENIDNERYLEVWNIVFSEFLNIDGKITPSPRKNIDTGAGLERLLSVLENKDSNFENSLFAPLIAFLNTYFSSASQALWAPVDYLRTTCVLLSQGVFFGSKGREYVLRKLFRKALWLLRNIEHKELKKEFFEQLVLEVGKSLEAFHPTILKEHSYITEDLEKEYLLSLKSYEQASNLLSTLIKKYSEEIPAQEIFDLVATHGLELWLIKNTLNKEGRHFNIEEYEELQQKHKVVSFNTNISSAFIKQNKNLLNLTLDSVMDYEVISLNSEIIAIFDESFEPINELNGKGYLVFKNTCIFPFSGGQDADKGFINDIEVEEALKAPNGQAIYGIRGNFKLGEKVVIKRDSNKRKGLERHHTLEHLLLALLKKEISNNIERSSGQKYSNYFNLEITLPKELDRNDLNIDFLNEKLNELIKEDLEVKISYLTLKEAKDLNLPQQFEEVYKKSENKLRYVQIGEYSKELCAGTHVSSTSEIEVAQIAGLKKKYANIYKFKVIAGKALVEAYLKKVSAQTKSTKKLDLKSEQKSFKSYIAEHINKEGLIILREKEIDAQVIMRAFKELRNELKNNTIFLFSGMKYFVISDAIDVLKLLDFLKIKYGWKGGGNVGYGTGLAKEISDTFEIELMNYYEELIGNH
ncbi:alanine--tRNA ligase [Candidatus Mycoplasma haematobovis]|uniref:Alanine--tRNA ligase n=1 Tax=Candidatus Mycoplasma haematobovis TaxID=432608 RepID=A0A1A9QC93_9MOLU|nr:alanine--tRNA ligase [Candidatus Mycoplasma haematobovis]OAL10192.1 alanine--tRNA ligase [Candidatus Mycoplasma haematobovis]